MSRKSARERFRERSARERRERLRSKPVYAFLVYIVTTDGTTAGESIKQHVRPTALTDMLKRAVGGPVKHRVEVVRHGETVMWIDGEQWLEQSQRDQDDPREMVSWETYWQRVVASHGKAAG